ncbi:DUF2877 domain-containing protein [Aerococcaceae bacterium zg-ZUI334]|uniref:DUF2877 domain-containing protein n=1 Tax=Aerococcaceae bacterium zg-252 TaxID=2796928 RepID=UPI001B983D1B|nr:DUF2877 domain-containing protein [Aerococcaceae bacterium zg-ZUI334]
MINQIVVTDSIDVSNYLYSLLLEHQLFRVVSIFKSGFNIKPVKSSRPFDLIYVSISDENRFSVLNCGLKDVELFKHILGNLHLDDRIVLTPKKMVIYSINQLISIKLKQINYIDTSILDCQLSKDDLTYFKENLSYCHYVHQSGFDSPSLNQILKEWHSLGFHKDAFEKFFPLIEKLIGNGKGLTPSGDDFLQGYLLALKLTGQNSDEFEKILFDLLLTHTTTDVSWAYYAALSRQYTSTMWLNLVRAVKSKNIREAEKAINTILSIGHTSGQDMLIGFLSLIDKI